MNPLPGAFEPAWANIRGNMISVFRIYLGQAWHKHGAAANLRTLLDTMPEFLHSVIVLSPEAAKAAETSPEARRDAVRVAMTQAHVAMMWGGEAPRDDEWSTHEIHIARTGFRRRIPILTVTPPASSAHDTLSVRAADRLEAWHAPAIAYAVQELAESAAAERRHLLRQLKIEAQDTVPATLLPETRIASHLARTLPTHEIAEAFATFRANRASGSGPASTDGSA